jgi:cell division septation protein DedD
MNKQLAIWVAVVLGAILVVIAFFVFKNPVSHLFKSKKHSVHFEQSVMDQLADSMMASANDSTLYVGEDPSETIPEEVHGDQVVSNRFYIVAGCFRNENNADELVRSLINKGYKAEKFGKIGDLHAVSFASFDDKELAVKELERIRKEFHADAWMTRF